MMLSEHKLSYDEWLKENVHLLEENVNKEKLHEMYEEYLKGFDNSTNKDS